jgi:3-dehydroquinate synthase
MQRLDQLFSVTFRYPVIFTRAAFSSSNLAVREVIGFASPRVPVDLVAVVDAGVAAAHPDLVPAIGRYVRERHDALRLAAPVLIVPGGESVKNDPVHLDTIHRTIHDARLCRHSYVLAIGGGAVLDAAGYAAATAHRGIRLVRMPTTVLAQDDSGVGVKNGVNAFGQKNYFGTFAAPAAVINDFDFLRTLDDRDWLGGLSEAIKVGLVKDAAFVGQLEQLAPQLIARDPTAMESVIRRSASLHLDHIAGADPFELGSSRPLDFGHWAAHKIEQLSRHRIRHGEAVAVGMAVDATYAWLKGLLPESDWRRVIDLIVSLRLPMFAAELTTRLDTPDHAQSLFRGLQEFREHLGGQLTVMLLEGVGKPVDVHDVDTNVMIRAIRLLQDLDTSGGSGVCAGSVATPVEHRS